MFRMYNQPASFLWTRLFLCVSRSGLWAQRQPIKCLKGLVRNFLAVSRWGVLEWVLLSSATEVIWEQA